MNFCSHCGSARLVRKVPEGDNLPRLVCEDCHTIHYQNPKVVTGCLPVWEDKILLCKRAIEPRYGLWTLPAGFMENNETLEQAAVRETWEEANATLEQLSLYSVLSLPHISQVYMMFRAQLRDLSFAPGTESLEVQLFSQNEIPWDDLAFPVIHRTLTHYFQDRLTGDFPVHVGDIIPHTLSSKRKN
ncbi:MutT/nudix family protein [Candidatus Thiomargarita nelsonii]|uniref:MutT/nudix family protein n=1 Tax=Candidatus Thiomargarita nelsonii TaxID=1003181 RepID=A0A176RU21_9GAMM|nr:MutT/nudix family protein [Candidatus Thiomargarita nelsonii]